MTRLGIVSERGQCVPISQFATRREERFSRVFAEKCDKCISSSLRCSFSKTCAHTFLSKSLKSILHLGNCSIHMSAPVIFTDGEIVCEREREREREPFLILLKENHISFIRHESASSPPLHPTLFSEASSTILTRRDRQTIEDARPYVPCAGFGNRKRSAESSRRRPVTARERRSHNGMHRLRLIVRYDVDEVDTRCPPNYRNCARRVGHQVPAVYNIFFGIQHLHNIVVSAIFENNTYAVQQLPLCNVIALKFHLFSEIHIRLFREEWMFSEKTQSLGTSSLSLDHRSCVSKCPKGISVFGRFEIRCTLAYLRCNRRNHRLELGPSDTRPLGSRTFAPTRRPFNHDR
ncbi:uncharacterized protein LOC112590447 isoform X1 [Harpegnathos saltator]|uniref:uncharacterized protein LOC112590447 isoform X1 n=1 Tax=Harpegnathos saltator TaxID=610380 RepID=UPI000DBEE270|nr:uncharacterized protein LOC112590447 isoform X1 [Harpegnathos saltator]